MMSQRQIKQSAIIFWLLFVVFTYLLVSRYQNNKLWSYLPMGQFLSFWLGILFLRPKWFLDQFNWQLLKKATLSAFLLYLGFPAFPFPFTLLLFIAFVPLLEVADKLLTVNKGYKKYWFLTFHCFLLWNITSTFWVANTAYAAGIFANLANAFLMTLPLMAYFFIKKNMGKRLSILALISAWLTFEFLHMRWELYWPWLTLGNGLSTLHWAIQWYEFSGVLGGSGWILVMNYLIFENKDALFSKRLQSAVLPVLLFFLPICLSLYLYYQPLESSGQIKVAAVQTDMEPHYEKFNIPMEEQARIFLNRIEPEIDDSVEYLLLPETVFNYPNLDQWTQGQLYAILQDFLDSHPNIKFITGLGAYRFVDQEDWDLPTSRKMGDVYIESYNCAVQLEAGKPVQEYYKKLFVPGAEFFPFRNVLFFFKPLIDQLGGTIEGYRTLKEYQLFKSENIQIAPLICYESIFGEYTNRLIRQGADAIVIMTNDGWWDNTPGHRQHTLFGRLRAIESRRSIARSANMGNSCFINARGDISNATPYGNYSVIKGTIELHKKITFYTKWGDLVGRLMLFIFSLLLLRAVVKSKVSAE